MLLVTGGRSSPDSYLSSTEVSLSSFHCLSVQNLISHSCWKPNFSFLLKEKVRFKPLGRLFEWDPTGVERGGGRTACSAKEGAASCLGRRYPLCHLWLWWEPRTRSWPGTQWPSLGRQLGILLCGDTTMQPLPLQLHLCNVDLKWFSNIKQR